MNPLIALGTANARRMFHRNYIAWLKYAASSVAINIVDPFVYFLALGLGLGAYVQLTGHVTLMAYIAPGLLGMSAMNAATFDACWGCFERLNLNGVYESIVTGPVDPLEIAAGEYLWQSFRAALYGTLFLVAVVAFGLVHSWWILLTPVIMALAGLAFGVPSFYVAMKVATQEHLFFYFSFVITPMIMFGGVFFPLDRMPRWVVDLAWCTPLYHAVAACRPLLNGPPTMAVAMDMLWLVAFSVAMMFVPWRVLRAKLGN
jgi:lipooligosaccharide transport system permease protein